MRKQSSLLTLSTWLICLWMCGAEPAQARGAWRSQLYPADWQPGYADDSGRYLPDYSYAGYHGGTVDLPAQGPGPLYDVTAAPFLADSSGRRDASAAIQQAIDTAAAAGGGTVYMPAGTYRLVVRGEQALRIAASNIVLRGDGPGKTFLLSDSPAMRKKQVILVAPDYAGPRTVWNSAEIALDEVPLSADAPADSMSVAVPDAAAFQVGERVLIRNSLTNDFIAEMQAEYTPNEGEGLMYYRTIAGIDREANTLRLDAPLRFDLQLRDRARLTRIMAPLEEIGIEGFSFGMRQSLKPGFGENDHAQEGTGGYDVHQSAFLQMNHVENGWVRNLSSYLPAENRIPVEHLPMFGFESVSSPPHILSKGIRLESCRHITVDRVDIRYPQYLGGGGNGYLLQMDANDVLVTNSTFIGGRHNLMISGVRSSGNVVFNNVIKDEYISSDHHGNMSSSNLFDSNLLSGAVFHARYNELAGASSGPTTTRTTYWNTRVGHCQVRWRGTDGEQKADHFVVSHQHGWGYVIGSRGSDRSCTRPHTAVRATRGAEGRGTSPEDYVEGMDQGASLQPQSLYLDQLAKRKQRLSAGRPAVQEAEAFSASGGIWETRGVIGLELGDGYITGFDIDDWVLYRGVDFGERSTTLTMSASVRPAFGHIDIRLGGPDGPLIGSYTLDATKEASADPHRFVTVRYPISPTGGVHDVYIHGSRAHGLAEIDWFSFDQSPPDRTPLAELSADRAELSADRAELRADLQAGDLAYLDRDYRYAEVDGALAGSLYLTPRLDEKVTSADSLFSLRLNRPATLYLAYDPRIPGLPEWARASEWRPAGAIRLVTDEQQWGLRSFDLYRLDVPAGSFVLGGNCPSGVDCAGYTHYLLVIAERE